MQNILRKFPHNNTNIGISIIDILLVFALIALLVGLSTPNIVNFVNAYKLRIAVSDLSSYIHRAKIIAAKNNISVTLDLEPEGFTGYMIQDANNEIIAAVSFGGCDHPILTFHRCYGGKVIYEKPLAEDDDQPQTLTIKPNGLSRRGFAYLTNQGKKRYYRVGILSAAGLVGAEKWNGSEWE